MPEPLLPCQPVVRVVLQNVTATVNMRIAIDPPSLANKIRHAEYNPKKLPAVVSPSAVARCLVDASQMEVENKAMRWLRSGVRFSGRRMFVRYLEERKAEISSLVINALTASSVKPFICVTPRRRSSFRISRVSAAG